MAAVLAKEGHYRIASSGSEADGKLKLIKYKDDFNRRVGPRRNFVEGVEGKYLCRLAVIQQLEIVLNKVGDENTGLHGNYNVQLDEALCRLCGVA